MKKKIFLCFLVSMVTSSVIHAQKSESSSQVFRFYLSQAPDSLDPASFGKSETHHLISLMYQGLYKYDDKKGLQPLGATECKWIHPKKLQCALNQKIKWSDGSPVLAEDYVRAFRHLINPKTKATDLHHLMRIKNAKKILNEKENVLSLGVQAPSDFILIFDFEEKDPEFIAKLSASILIPLKKIPDINKPQEIITNGPYQMTKFVRGQKAYLKPNAFYPYGNLSRPDIEVLFIEEDVTAQNLYDIGKLDLQHRMNTAFIPKYKDLKDFYQKTFTRFDYIGFGPRLQKNIKLRKALSLSVNYDELKDILFAKGRPGCPGLTQNYIDHIPCYPFDPKQAKKILNEIPKDERPEKLTMKFSRAGGDNILRIMEWYQNQWQKNLGIKIELNSVEQGMYLQDLKTNPPDLFRKGINQDRPTCLSALESFRSDSSDNYLHLNSLKINKSLDQLENAFQKPQERKLCESSVRLLMDEYRMIPQGVIHFSMLVSPRFSGFEFNELNQIDVSNLKWNED